MLRYASRVGATVFAFALLATPASAQIVQSLQIGGGGFFPRAEAARANGDVLNEDLNSLAFRISDFKSGQVSGEWMVAFGDHLEVGAGIGFHSGGANTVYLDYTHPDGTEIEQQLRLRVVPITGMVRFLAGRPGKPQPYFGVGVAAMNFQYSESGEFVDFTDFSTFRNRYVANGTAVGPVVALGLRVPISGDIYAFTMEWRHYGIIGGEAPVGKLGGISNGFLTDRIDLGGSAVNFGFLIRF